MHALRRWCPERRGVRDGGRATRARARDAKRDRRPRGDPAREALLREYVVVDETARLVEHHERQGNGETWLMTVRRSGPLALSSIDATLSIDDLWVDVDRVKKAPIR